MRVYFLKTAYILLIISLAFNISTFAGWSEPMRISEHGGYSLPQILAQGDTLHIVYHDGNIYEKIDYQRSSDGGLTWSQARVLSGDSCAVIFPKIMGNAPNLIAIWRNNFDLGLHPMNIGYSTSSDNGRTWASPRYVFNPGYTQNLYFAASAGYGQNVNIVYSIDINDSLIFYSTRSTNFGQSWSTPAEIFAAVQSGVPDQAGMGNRVHFVWDGRFDWVHPVDIYYIQSSDGGINWTSNIPLSDTDQYHSQLPCITINGEGHPCVAWMDFKYSPYMFTGDILGRQSPDSGLNWGLEWQASYDHYASLSAIAANGDTIHIAWQDEAAGIIHRSIYYTQSTDNGVTWSDPYWIDGTLDNSWDPALAVSNGRVYAAWCDGTYNPDTTSHWGLYFSRWDPEPDIIGGNQSNLPYKIALTVYPNPFNSSISIKYSNLSEGDGINIFNVNGQLVKSFRIKGDRNGKIIWDATDASGKKVSSGIYFAKAEACGQSVSVKLLFLK